MNEPIAAPALPNTQCSEPAAAQPARAKPAVSRLGGSFGHPLDQRAALLAPIRELGLEPYRVELDANGYTTIPSGLVAPPEFVERVQDALLRVIEKRTGVKHRVDRNGDNGRYQVQSARKENYPLYRLLFEDIVFEEWLENPALQAMINYSLRGMAHLTVSNSLVKSRDPSGDPNKWTVPLHADSPALPDGTLLHGGELFCNSAFVVTDYTAENGAITFVPGSHQLGRQPAPGEGEKYAIPIEAPRGSLIIFKGGVWHGSRAKMTDGLRLNLTTSFTNRAIKTIEGYQRDVPKEILGRRSEQFARYVGADDSHGFGPEGPQPTYLRPSSFT